MLSYAGQLAQRMEVVRELLGGRPIVLTSFVRSESTTQHREGTAIDFRLPDGVNAWQAATMLQGLAGRGVTWGQLIHYPFEGRPHVHLSLPTGVARGAVLVQDATGRYVTLTGQILAAFPQAAGGWIAAAPGTTVEGPADEGTSHVGALGAIAIAGALGLLAWAALT